MCLTQCTCAKNCSRDTHRFARRYFGMKYLLHVQWVDTFAKSARGKRMPVRLPCLLPHEVIYAMMKREPRMMRDWLGLAECKRFLAHCKNHPMPWYKNHPLRSQIEIDEGEDWVPIRVFGDDFQTTKKSCQIFGLACNYAQSEIQNSDSTCVILSVRLAFAH